MNTQAKQKVAVAVAVALAVGGALYLAMPGLFGKRTQQNTNDAYVSADFTLVVPRVAGFIKQVLVEDNQQVRAGQLLALIDDRDLRAAAEAADAETLVARAQLQNARATLERQASVIAQAQSSVVSAKAEMAFAEHELNRYNHLAGVGAGTVQNAQQAQTRIDQASARLANATAVLAAERKQVDILDRKSTRLNSSHVEISYAVFCLKKKKPTSALRGEDIFRPGDPARRRAALAEDRLRDGVIAQVLALHAQRVAMGQTELFERHRLFDFGHGVQFFLLLLRQPPGSTLFPYTTLFR